MITTSVIVTCDFCGVRAVNTDGKNETDLCAMLIDAGWVVGRTVGMPSYGQAMCDLCRKRAEGPS